MKSRLITFLFVISSLAALGQPVLVGHRGSNFGVESTMEAFENGLRLGYTMMESDVKVAVDGRFVLSHDNDLSRLGSGLVVAESTLGELQADTLVQTRLGKQYRGRLCSLEEWLEFCRDNGVRPVVELKWARGVNNEDCSNIPALVAELDAAEMRDKVILLTSMKTVLENIRRNYPDIALQFLARDTWPNHFEWCKRWRIDVDIQSGCFTADDVRAFHEAGLKVNVWTVNKEEDYRRYADWGCDFVTTDRLDNATRREVTE